MIDLRKHTIWRQGRMRLDIEGVLCEVQDLNLNPWVVIDLGYGLYKQESRSWTSPLNSAVASWSKFIDAGNIKDNHGRKLKKNYAFRNWFKL
jgi:hypothetical protein